MSWLDFEEEDARSIARDLGRIANALERIADAFEPATAAVSAPPAQPEVGGVRLAED